MTLGWGLEHESADAGSDAQARRLASPGLSESQTQMCAEQTLLSLELPKLGAEIVQEAEPLA